MAEAIFAVTSVAFVVMVELLGAEMAEALTVKLVDEFGVVPAEELESVMAEVPAVGIDGVA